ncbi:hypothetical protein NE237_007646 [Protea cynaroides]|uniref:Late embryogenesis abundant protein LEA-2 subgroup domain-containing protein n=1 Tax=Protea cynaroides TaxID=273540 RepID=A0A9Q0QWK9_9MAGN|nr:hypothetical protein NE237_007646 [Protea cynaroides]
MTESVEYAVMEQHQPQDPRKRRRSCFARSVLIILLLLILLLIIILILAFTVFKIKDPTTTIVSTTVEGISPKVQAVPQPKIELNITLNLHIVVHNPNHASFTHGTGGAALVYYHGSQVGVAVIPPGTIPSNGNGTIYSEVTLEAELFMSKIGELLQDVIAGELEIETKSTVPGRVKILGIFQKHVVSVSDCQIVIGISDLKVRQQVCNYGIKY